MYDILCTADDNAHTLWHQTTEFMMSHPLQSWHHTPCIIHHTNCIFVITTSPLISHPLLYDITPTICVTSYALYITTYPILISSHYSTYDSTNLTYETTSSMQLKIYTIHVTSQSLVCVITPTVLRASHPLFVWHHTWHMYSIFCTIGDITSSLYEIKPPFYDITPTVFDIVSTLFLSPLPLYWWYHTKYIYEIPSSIYVDIISIVYNKIFTIFVPSQPLPVSHTHTFHDITPFVYMTLHSLYV